MNRKTLEDVLHDLRIKNDDLIDKNKLLENSRDKNDMSSLNEHLLALRNENVGLHQTLTDLLEEKKSALRHLEDQCNSNISIMRDELKKKQVDIENYEKQNKSLKQELENKIIEESNNISLLNEKINILEQTNQQLMKDTTNNIENLKIELKSSNDQCDSLKSFINNFESNKVEVDIFQNKINELQKINLDLEQKYNELIQSVNIKENQLLQITDDKEKKLFNLNKEIEDLKNINKELECSLSIASENIKYSNNIKEEEISKIKDQLDEVKIINKQELELINSSLEFEKNNSKCLLETLETLKKQLEDVSNDNNIYKQKSEYNQQQLEESLEKIKTSILTEQQLKEELNTKEEIIQSNGKEIISLKLQITNIEEELKSAKATIENNSRRIDNKENTTGSSEMDGFKARDNELKRLAIANDRLTKDVTIKEETLASTLALLKKKEG